MEWKGHKQAPSSFSELELQPCSQLMPPFIELCPCTAHRQQPPTCSGQTCWLSLPNLLTKSTASWLPPACSSVPVSHGVCSLLVPRSRISPAALQVWKLASPSWPHCPFLVPATAPISPSGFNLVLQKAQNTFLPLILVGSGFWLFSKLTHQIHLSLWADSQESPEVEWEEDRTTTFRKPVLTNCKIIHELGKTETWLHLSFWLHISIHLLLFVCILQHKKCKKIFWCRFPENNGRFWMWTDF